MKVKSVRYSRLYQHPSKQYENERIEVELEPTCVADTAVELLRQARELAYMGSMRFDKQKVKAQCILANPEGHPHGDVLWAQNFTETFGFKKGRKPTQQRLFE